MQFPFSIPSAKRSPTGLFCRRALCRVIVAGIALHATMAVADDRSSVKIRMPKETTVAAKSGQDYAGEFELLVPKSGELTRIVVGGEGWATTEIDPPGGPKVVAGQSVKIPFHLLCIDEHKPLEIRVTFDSHTRKKRFDLSPERFARHGKPRPMVRLPAGGQEQGPGNGDDASAPHGACQDQLIRFRGRIAYMRPGVDNNGDGDFVDPGTDSNGDGDYDDPGDVPPDVAPAIVGADRIEFSIMDDDIIDEEIFRGLTNENGTFDVTVCWDDCDISGCDDPDIYLYVECDTDIVNVQDGNDILEEDYNWSTESSQYYPDYTGHDIDFGTVLPADPAEYPAIHIHNTITRTHRFVQENGGGSIAHVDVQWPETNTEYNRFFEEIYIQPIEQWNEATQAHEWGHHLLYEWNSAGSGDYCNGYCDATNPGCGNDPCDDDGGHCVWCQENAGDAWNEGMPDWLGSVVVRSWQPRYGIPPLTQIGGMNRDTRYILESAQNCCDGTSHTAFAWITEGFVGMMLRDIEDPAPELPAGPPYACPQDALNMSPSDILAVVHDTHPTVMMSFLQSFWTRYPQRAHDILATATAVAPVYGASLPAPPIVIYGTSSCDVAKVGQPITLHVETNGSPWSLKMQWHRDGVPLLDSTTRTGCFKDTLTIISAAPTDAGIYTLKVSLCNGTQEQWSPPMPVYVFGATGGGHHVTGWGRNVGGSLGHGTYEPTNSDPTDVANLNNAIAVSAGYWNAVALLSDGTVKSWGSAYLGNGTATASATPVTVSGLSNVVAVSAGGYEACMALGADGQVWTWGSNWYGELGDGSGQWSMTPVQVPGLSCIVGISMGAYTAAAVTAGGRLYTWGSNSNGQLGIGVFGGMRTTPQLVPGLTDVVEVECGWTHIIARKADGTVWTCGGNAYGQLGDGTGDDRSTFVQVPGITNAVSVKAGALHSLMVKADRTPWSWGFDDGSRPTTGNIPVPTRCTEPQSVRMVDAGYYNSVFVDMDGVIWTSGYWGYGALGRANATPAPLPVASNVGGAVKVSAGIDFMHVIAPGARITSQPIDQIVAGCGRADLRVGATGEAPVVYQWQRFNGTNWDVLFEGGRLTGTNTSVLTISPTNASDTGLYRVAVTNATNDVFTRDVFLQTPPPMDSFDSGPNPRWLGERGGWTIAGGGYSAGTPSLIPATYSSFHLPMTDFSIEFDVRQATYSGLTANTGVWLRSSLTASQPSGILLSLGDPAPFNTGDVFWTQWNGSSFSSPQGVVQGLYGEGDTVHMRVDVRGSTYTAYVNDATAPTTTLVTSDYPAGRIALFDNAATDTLFDNVFIQTLPNCEPGSGLLPPRVVTRPQSQSVSAGSPVTLSITVSGDGPLTFQWLRNGVCIPGADSTTYLFTATTATAGRYECTVTSPCGSVSSFPAFITVTGGPPPGDIDGDGMANVNDVAPFAAVQLGQDLQPAHIQRADLNGDGVANGLDVQPFARALAH